MNAHFFGSLRLRPSPSLSQRERDKFAVFSRGRGIDFKKETAPLPEGEAGVRGLNDNLSNTLT